MQVRLDKYLADAGLGSRAQVRDLLRAGRVLVNGMPEKSPKRKLDPEVETVCLDGSRVFTETSHWFMMNKPAGCVTAHTDRERPTVMDLMKPFTSHRVRLSPVGRLDLDTEGLLLLTDDGETAHRLLSPARHVAKTYQAVLEGDITREQIRRFAEGLDIGDEKKAKPGELEVLEKKGPVTFAEITVTEGRYHQVKRMAESIGSRVLYLRRVRMGGLSLDLSLPAGGVRPLTEEEISRLTGVSDIGL